jgi:hypothetical protein
MEGPAYLCLTTIAIMIRDSNFVEEAMELPYDGINLL